MVPYSPPYVSPELSISGNIDSVSRDDPTPADGQRGSTTMSQVPAASKLSNQDPEWDEYIAHRIPRLYRVFDLVHEQGNGGQVDKVIVAQDGLKRLINDISPGAYVTLTRVDFKTLDSLSIRPIGVYGDRTEIANFLFSLNILDEDTLRLLQHSKDDSSEPALRSGIYIARPIHPTDVLYAVYWPQDTTWEDHAQSEPRGNRRTFMRCLTEISEQILCFMSPAQSQALGWGHEEKESIEESIVSRPGFRIELQPVQASETFESEQARVPHTTLMLGEGAQGFLSSKYLPPRTDEKVVNGTITRSRLRELLSGSIIRIGCKLSEKVIIALMKDGLETGAYERPCTDWLERRDVIAKDTEKARADRMAELSKGLLGKADTVDKGVTAYLVGKVLEKYPSLDPARLSKRIAKITQDEFSELKDKVAGPLSRHPLHPSLIDLEKKLLELPSAFRDQKHRVVCVRVISRKYGQHYQEDLIRTVIREGCPEKLRAKQTNSSRLLFFLSTSEMIPDIDIAKDVARYCELLTDRVFLANLDRYVKDEPLVEPAVRRCLDAAYDYISSILMEALSVLIPVVSKKQHEAAQAQLFWELNSTQQDALNRSTNVFIEQINSMSEDRSSLIPFVTLESLDILSGGTWGDSYVISARRLLHIESAFEYRINKLEISSDHRHNLQLDPSFIPTPYINYQGSLSLTIPPHHQILHSQLLENGRILLLIDQCEEFALYLDSLSNIGDTLQLSRPKRLLYKDEVGSEILLTLDETKRLLTLCAPRRHTLHVFVFDENLGCLQSWARPFEVANCYGDNETITCVCFVTGTDEVLLVDSGAQARIYSLVKRQFRTAAVALPEIPISVMSSPDGTCALLVFQVADRRILTAYRWDTFGASEGISIVLPENCGSLSVTSFVNRQSVHLMMLEEEKCYCQSLALVLSEFPFKGKGVDVREGTGKRGNYVNNRLLDCFGEIWTQFPVVASVSRGAAISSATRRAKAVIFVSNQVHGKYASYFSDMIKSFEVQMKKPTNGHLQAICIDAKTYPDVVQDPSHTFAGSISQFSAGQWFTNLLCLLPIQIAVARDNCFIPLKDGVSSAEFEKSLLGVEVGRIVDNLSLGWYECILRSYVADKPVRVISSMGERSVGKSFALNHLMNASFVVGDVGKTEGVWMSITPTEDALLVALDFEGVRSTACSSQGDAFFVLFSAAISNLVLFRTNFALSRDIGGLFRPFQAASLILDPAANPSLFQSTLVVVIKDVIESERATIGREFSLKLQEILAEEQGTNFISRLHAGRLDIIPWPVIGSRQFYALFSTLERRLSLAKITHLSAGQFLYTLKLLMAKLKANDWGSISQSLASHRAQTMLAILPVALQYGLANVGSENEPLKNLDNDTVIECPDTPFRLFLSTQSLGVHGREETLADLRHTWGKYDARHEMDEVTWMNELGTYLKDTVKLRIFHVESWISTNLQQYKANSTHADLLRREMENGAADLLTNVDLCKLTCSNCSLHCTLSRRHDPSLRPHDCHTGHQCPHPCDYAADHPQGTRSCHSPAGHDGPHVCAVDNHLCGEACIYSNVNCCQIICVQLAGHSGDHLCSARRHACGKPCRLQISLPDGSIQYTCPGKCSFLHDEHHDQHVCDSQMCPMLCKLCMRLCGSNHLHGLDSSSVHLCGESHRCRELCGAGICRIDTASQIATFRGRYETFQYMKYNQAAKRLLCIKPIPAGECEHEGQHTHSLDPPSFHFCEIRCGNCGYFCTLPRGHPQQEHETRHGSMSNTRWTVDDPDGIATDLNGHRFGANDEGAPMCCDLVCQGMGRHVHVDYCRANLGQTCTGCDHEHINTCLAPHPERPKDWISHQLYWRRLGFRDPYSADDRANFTKCDAMCPGPEHVNNASQAAQPSYCVLPIFHIPHVTNRLTGFGYVSNDGHLFSCENPATMPQAFHVIFVVGRSRSMCQGTPVPLHSTPVTSMILQRHNNRLGAVYLSLYGFWQSRQATLAGSETRALGQAVTPARRDAYSVILFNHSITRCFENDFQHTPEDLLRTLLQYDADGGTNCEGAIRETESVMRDHWSTERAPVVIFLSDGDCNVQDSTIHGLCSTANSLGRQLPFHAVSFGTTNESLRRMARIAREVEANGPSDSSLPARARIESSYVEAFDSFRLGETFLGVTGPLKKTRCGLLS